MEVDEPLNKCAGGELDPLVEENEEAGIFDIVKSVQGNLQKRKDAKDKNEFK